LPLGQDHDGVGFEADEIGVVCEGLTEGKTLGLRFVEGAGLAVVGGPGLSLDVVFSGTENSVAGFSKRPCDRVEKGKIEIWDALHWAGEVDGARWRPWEWDHLASPYD